MFLTAHSLIALSSTKFINDPASLFFLNFFLHYVFDAIPHGKENTITKGFSNDKKNLAAMAFLDLFFTATLFLLFYKNYNTSLIKIIPAVLGAVAPDFLWGFYRVFNVKFFKWASDINHFAHQVFNIEQKSILFYCFQAIPILIFLLTFYK